MDPVYPYIGVANGHKFWVTVVELPQWDRYLDVKLTVHGGGCTLNQMEWQWRHDSPTIMKHIDFVLTHTVPSQRCTVTFSSEGNATHFDLDSFQNPSLTTFTKEFQALAHVTLQKSSRSIYIGDANADAWVVVASQPRSDVTLTPIAMPPGSVQFEPSVIRWDDDLVTKKALRVTGVSVHGAISVSFVLTAPTIYNPTPPSFFGQLSVLPLISVVVDRCPTMIRQYESYSLTVALGAVPASNVRMVAEASSPSAVSIEPMSHTFTSTDFVALTRTFTIKALRQVPSVNLSFAMLDVNGPNYEHRVCADVLFDVPFQTIDFPDLDTSDPIFVSEVNGRNIAIKFPSHRCADDARLKVTTTIGTTTMVQYVSNPRNGIVSNFMVMSAVLTGLAHVSFEVLLAPCLRVPESLTFTIRPMFTVAVDPTALTFFQYQTRTFVVQLESNVIIGDRNVTVSFKPKNTVPEAFTITPPTAIFKKGTGTTVTVVIKANIVSLSPLVIDAMTDEGSDTRYTTLDMSPLRCTVRPQKNVAGVIPLINPMFLNQTTSVYVRIEDIPSATGGYINITLGLSGGTALDVNPSHVHVDSSYKGSLVFSFVVTTPSTTKGTEAFEVRLSGPAASEYLQSVVIEPNFSVLRRHTLSVIHPELIERTQFMTVVNRQDVRVGPEGYLRLSDMTLVPKHNVTSLNDEIKVVFQPSSLTWRFGLSSPLQILTFYVDAVKPRRASYPIEIWIEPSVIPDDVEGTTLRLPTITFLTLIPFKATVPQPLMFAGVQNKVTMSIYTPDTSYLSDGGDDLTISPISPSATFYPSLVHVKRGSNLIDVNVTALFASNVPITISFRVFAQFTMYSKDIESKSIRVLPMARLELFRTDGNVSTSRIDLIQSVQSPNVVMYSLALTSEFYEYFSSPTANKEVIINASVAHSPRGMTVSPSVFLFTSNQPYRMTVFSVSATLIGPQLLTVKINTKDATYIQPTLQIPVESIPQYTFNAYGFADVVVEGALSTFRLQPTGRTNSKVILYAKTCPSFEVLCGTPARVCLSVIWRSSEEIIEKIMHIRLLGKAPLRCLVEFTTEGDGSFRSLVFSRTLQFVPLAEIILSGEPEKTHMSDVRAHGLSFSLRVGWSQFISDTSLQIALRVVRSEDDLAALGPSHPIVVVFNSLFDSVKNVSVKVRVAQDSHALMITVPAVSHLPTITLGTDVTIVVRQSATTNGTFTETKLLRHIIGDELVIVDKSAVNSAKSAAGAAMLVGSAANVGAATSLGKV
eukprot:PhM_4_TR18601/c0_g4_i1/m.30889